MARAGQSVIRRQRPRILRLLQKPTSIPESEAYRAWETGHTSQENTASQLSTSRALQLVPQYAQTSAPELTVTDFAI
jgi:hypothetical protein